MIRNRVWMGLLCLLLMQTTAWADGAAGADSAETARAKFERDRQAILAMAGEYHVDFHFEETVPLRPGYELREPYHSAATEFVEVVEDAGERIVLQHILVLHPKGGEGEAEDAPAGGRVVKHWRQDWEYEARDLYDYRGNRRWEPRTLAAEEARGTWTQRVYQVDDSPRYQGYGRWVHEGNLSAWQSSVTWRPLPRREYTKRSDYQVLAAVNRHTLTPSGWVHEQDNYKLVLNEAGEVADEPVLCRETGLNTYTRLSPGEVDFQAGREYWQKTQGYWQDVRAAWADIFQRGEAVVLRGTVDGDPLWKHMRKLGDELTAGAYGREMGRAAIERTLARFLVDESPAQQTRLDDR